MTTEALCADLIYAILAMNAYRHLDNAPYGIAAVNRGDGLSEMSRTSPAKGLPSWAEAPKIGCADGGYGVALRNSAFGRKPFEAAGQVLGSRISPARGWEGEWRVFPSCLGRLLCFI